MLGAMDLGVTDDSERAGHEQAAQIAVTLFVLENTVHRSRGRLRLQPGLDGLE